MSTATALPQLYSFGHALEMDDAKVGLLRDSADAANDVAELRQRFAEDGYLYMKGYLDRDDVRRPRHPHRRTRRRRRARRKLSRH